MNKELALKIGDELWLKGEETGIGQTPSLQTIGGWISVILPNVYMIASVILFILLFIGGLGIITSAGSGNEEGVQKGQKAVTASLAGFLIIFASWWIIKIIETITGVPILSR